MAASLALAAAALAGGGLALRRAGTREAAAEARFPPEGDFVTVAGRRVHYVAAGEGPPLVLIHGASGNTRDFTFGFLARVKDRYRTIVFDRPGLGYTDRAEEGLGGAFEARAESPAAQAALLSAAARKLGVARPVVLGHSYGGAVAMAWALEHDPAALVVVSGATQPWPGGLGALYAVTGSRLGGAGVVPLITAFAAERQVKAALASIFAPDAPPAGYLDHIAAPLTLRRANFRANARQVNTLRPHVVEMAPRYPALSLPIELVHGTADSIVPIDIHSRVLARQVASARLTELAGAGHMPHHTHADQVVAAIDRARARAGPG